MFDVAIIGAGVTGAMIARALTEYNLRICILEKNNDVAMGTTCANSAIVHAGFDAAEGTLKAKLNVRGSEMMRQIAAELGVKYQNNGALVIGFNEEDRPELEKLYRRGITNGVRNLRLIEEKELHELEPNVSENAICALYAPTSSIICPYELTIAAIGNAMDNGAELKLNFSVQEIEAKDGHYIVKSDTEEISANYVINAAGLYADRIAKLAGDESFSIFPRRGEYILFDRECGNHISHTVFSTPTRMGKGILITKTVDGNLLAGPTSQNITDKEDKSTTSEGIAKIIKETAGHINGVRFNKIITSFCGLRAVGSTGDFIINSPVKGFINVAGIESPGLSAAPAIAEYVVELLKEQGIFFERKKDYNPDRKPSRAFREAGIEEKNRIIKENPAFGRVVCRCETITEGEILEALRTNPKARDLDGVKRRTRAQMGRCQGGFCSPQIVELIAEELKIPYEQVTKFGGASFINLEKTK